MSGAWTDQAVDEFEKKGSEFLNVESKVFVAVYVRELSPD
jgi:hypothetical protein